MAIPQLDQLIELEGIVIPDDSVSYYQRVMLGNYANMYRGIEHFEIPMTVPAGPRQLAVALFDDFVVRWQVEERLKERRLAYALIDDILAVGANPKYDDLLTKIYIQAFGSPLGMSGYTFAPIISNRPKKEFNLQNFNIGYSVGTGFLVYPIEA